MDSIGERYGVVLLILAIFIRPVEPSVNRTCSESELTVCHDQFNENTLPVCSEVLKLKTCLEVCVGKKNWPSWGARLAYQSLVKKMNSYPDCIPESKVRKKECSEEYVSDCYKQYNHSATPICPEVKKLRICTSELTGCHAMKHPKFVLLRDILEKHRKCFFVNYTRILEVLKMKEPNYSNRSCTERLLNECQDQFKENTAPVCSKVLKLRACIASCVNVKSWPSWVAKVTYETLVRKIKESGPICKVATSKGETESPTIMNAMEKHSESKLEKQTGKLPYTFVVVATVSTCLFLVVLVVFSIVRHTTLSKRQRNSSIERAPMRIRIRSHSPRDRTRHHRHRHRRNHRGRAAAHSGAVRQTVSGFFEGNVAPPPYSAVLDDNESVRAGDPPPPYRPPSCMGIGVIV